MKKRRPFLNKSLDEIASSGDDAIIEGGSDRSAQLCRAARARNVNRLADEDLRTNHNA